MIADGAGKKLQKRSPRIAGIRTSSMGLADACDGNTAFHVFETPANAREQLTHTGRENHRKVKSISQLRNEGVSEAILSGGVGSVPT
jgi:hypothetical protein